ncbi:MAG: sulfite exporter TauE/SafE family protein [Pseudomonadota bacterium]
MVEMFAEALRTPDLLWVCFGALIAGVVRGFAGFGTAMIYLPVALSVLDKEVALITLLVMDLIGPIPNVPRFLRDGKLSELAKLVIGAAVLTPLTIIFIFEVISQDALRYTVSIVALVLLAMLVLGVRYRGVLKDWMLYLTGAIGGFLGGITGVPGPPVIMIYMASTNPPQVIRANNSLYLICFDIMMLTVFAIRGLLTLTAVVLGFIVSVPYLIGNQIGAWIFNPAHEQTYRYVAYVIIGASALWGLPIWN